MRQKKEVQNWNLILITMEKQSKTGGKAGSSPVQLAKCTWR